MFVGITDVCHVTGQCYLPVDLMQTRVTCRLDLPSRYCLCTRQQKQGCSVYKCLLVLVSIFCSTECTRRQGRGHYLHLWELKHLRQLLQTEAAVVAAIGEQVGLQPTLLQEIAESMLIPCSLTQNRRHCEAVWFEQS